MNFTLGHFFKIANYFSIYRLFAYASEEGQESFTAMTGYELIRALTQLLGHISRVVGGIPNFTIKK